LVVETVFVTDTHHEQWGAVIRLRFSYMIPMAVVALGAGLSAAPASAAASGTWAVTGSMNAARTGQTATLLSDGQVLAAGGVNFVSHKFTELASAELYTP
jgi:hypothetical protein